MRSPIEFVRAFITGVDEIDGQHRNLIYLTNEARRGFSASLAPREVRAMVQELLSYAIYHFRTEESLMREYDYLGTHAEQAEQHIQCHRDFSARVVEAQKALQNHEYVDTEALIDYLSDWIADHILGTDQHLAAFIRAKRAE